MFSVGAKVTVKPPFEQPEGVELTVAAIQFVNEAGEIVEHDTGVCQYILDGGIHTGAAYSEHFLELIT